MAVHRLRSDWKRTSRLIKWLVCCHKSKAGRVPDDDDFNPYREPPPILTEREREQRAKQMFGVTKGTT